MEFKKEKIKIGWSQELEVDDWIKSVDCRKLSNDFKRNGYLELENLINNSNVELYKRMYDKFLDGSIAAFRHRHDLGSHAGGSGENITQIMWPSAYVENMSDGPVHQRLLRLAQSIMGNDMSFDFDMLISKPACVDVSTPWHQDESYWLDMPDKRAVSFWVALQDVNIDNGCMWFVPGSNNQPLREHRKVKEGHHVNMCDCSEDEGLPVPLAAGGCTGHHGRTLHYTRGNKSAFPRRALIVNFRPQSMVEYERSHDYDHGLKGIDAIIFASQKDELKLLVAT